MEGTNEAMELAAGAGAATLGAALLEVVRRQGLLRFAPGLAAIAPVARLPAQILREFWILTVSLALDLARVRRVRSAWVAVPFEAGGRGPAAAGDRAPRPPLRHSSPPPILAPLDCDRGRALEQHPPPSPPPQ